MRQTIFSNYLLKKMCYQVKQHQCKIILWWQGVRNRLMPYTMSIWCIFNVHLMSRYRAWHHMDIIAQKNDITSRCVTMAWHIENKSNNLLTTFILVTKYFLFGILYSLTVWPIPIISNYYTNILLKRNLFLLLIYL